MNRRRLCIAASGAVLGTSGCLGVLSDRGLRLGRVVLANRRANSVVAHLQIRQGDRTVVDSEYSLESSDSAGSGTTIDDAWADRVETYTVTVALESGMEDSFTYNSDHGHGDCTAAYVGIRPSTIHFSTHEASDDGVCVTSGDR